MRLFSDEVIKWGKLGITIINFDEFQNFDTKEITKQLDLQLSIKGYSTKTKKAYTGHVIRFLKFTDKKPEDLNSTEFQDQKKKRNYRTY
ncbi:phage integrase N-terminal SAM-like domain-containing protein [Caloranaerobacter ferrireducens]|uniref:phage integrase N-terminal SAM-like domain-containing protein n=1 Tax=Caloranaerobacter ferrireducens TaxID=1323370 RepID=UPI001FA6FAF2|nr:phage integrase N-terminal SAM-like domain-containing protein [Caloranaerobacter ferrireducens]